MIDPIDGSLNAKREAAHYALSFAVADGATMADVELRLRARLRRARAMVGVARRGRRGCDGGARSTRRCTERRSHAGKLEVVGIESADPRWVVRSVDALAETAHRLRALGAIAVSLCEVAAARHDGMVTLRRAAAWTPPPDS